MATAAKNRYPRAPPGSAAHIRELAVDEDVEGDAEDPGQKDAGEKRRHRHAQLVEHRPGGVQRAAGSSGCPQPQGNGHRRDQQKAEKAQAQCDADLGGDQLPHRLVIAVGGPQIPGEEARQPGEIPHREGPVQSQLGLQLRHPLLRGLGAQHDLRRAAGDQIKGRERQKGDDDHGDQQHQDPPACVLHGIISPPGSRQTLCRAYEITAVYRTVDRSST